MDILNSINIESHLFQKVAIIVCQGQIAINGSMHICTTNETLHEALSSLKPSEDVSLNYVADYLGRAIYFANNNADVKSLIIHGDKQTDIVLEEQQLTCLSPITTAFRAILAVGEGRISMLDAVEDMRLANYFFVGLKPSSGSSIRPQDTVHKLTTVEIERGDKKIETVALFLSRESALRHANNGKVPVSEISLPEAAKLWNYQMPISIEPHESFSITIAPDTILQVEISHNN
ncbi:MAG: hypothetical protein MJZ27_05225 [Bacteroidales bacterium]|nr:hypothetical protein [Bacteroidales bacterium]